MNSPLATWMVRVGILSSLLQSAPAGDFGAKNATATPGPDGWRWNMRLGASYRNLGNIDFRSGSYSRNTVLPPVPNSLGAGAPNGIEQLGIGTLDDFADRTYIDGYVFIDPQTNNPSSFLPGTTAYWGYTSNSQVGGGNLYYSGGAYVTSSSASASFLAEGSWSDDFKGGTPVIEIEALKPLSRNLSVGFTAGFMFLSGDGGNSSTNFSATQTRTNSMFSVTDRYSLQGVIPPQAPYSGAYITPGIAPLIDNKPSERIISAAGTSVETIDFANQISESLDVNLYTLSLGPTIRYDIDRFYFSGSLGLAINITNWRADFGEKLNRQSAAGVSEIDSWNASNGGTTVLPGFYLQGSANYQLSEHWSASVIGRYDWSDSLSDRVGPSTFEVGLSGFTLAAALTFTF